MKFRPCIDLHNGQVKQIVGSTLNDKDASTIATNFSTDQPAADFAKRYQDDGLYGGHVIMLGPNNTEAARASLAAFPGGLQVGGGIQNVSMAQEWLAAGASHVILTSMLFRNGELQWDRLTELRDAIGKEKIVLDLSCRKRKRRLSCGHGSLADVHDDDSDTRDAAATGRVL